MLILVRLLRWSWSMLLLWLLLLGVVSLVVVLWLWPVIKLLMVMIGTEFLGTRTTATRRHNDIRLMV